MTEYDTIPIPPPSLGEVLADPAAYAQAAIAGLTLPSVLPGPVSPARHRRPRRAGRTYVWGIVSGSAR
jgi:hypothetical protein